MLGNTVQYNILSYRNQSIDMQSKSVALCLVYNLFQPPRNNFYFPELYLKKLTKKQLNFSSPIFCSIYKNWVTFHHFLHLSFPKVLYKSVLLYIIKVPHKNVLLSVITCHHLSLTYHTQTYFTKALYYLQSVTKYYGNFKKSV